MRRSGWSLKGDILATALVSGRNCLIEKCTFPLRSMHTETQQMSHVLPIRKHICNSQATLSLFCLRTDCRRVCSQTSPYGIMQATIIKHIGHCSISMSVYCVGHILLQPRTGPTWTVWPYLRHVWATWHCMFRLAYQPPGPAQAFDHKWWRRRRRIGETKASRFLQRCELPSQSCAVAVHSWL